MKIALIPNIDKDKDLLITKKVIGELKALGIEIYSNIEFISEDIKYIDNDTDIFKICDLIITIGGDGTILHVSKQASIFSKPILGINMGNVGYLADIEVNEINLLGNLKEGNYKCEERMMIFSRVIRNKQEVFNSTSLNDIVISKGTISRMIEFDVRSDNNFIHKYKADGIVFSTPTGSTAYSLSAGGPVVEPALNCILATPVCVHSIQAARSIVFNDNSKIEVKIISSDYSPAFITSDGVENFSLEKNDIIIIIKSMHMSKLIRIKEHSFYSILSRKLK